jgi:hypothetical protein
VVCCGTFSWETTAYVKIVSIFLGKLMRK